MSDVIGIALGLVSGLAIVVGYYAVRVYLIKRSH